MFIGIFTIPNTVSQKKGINDTLLMIDYQNFRNLIHC